MSPQRSTSRSKTVEILQRSDCLNIDDEEIRDLDNMLFPEGGWQAWMTIVGAFLVQFATFGYTNAFGVYQDFYVREYLHKYTPSDIGWIGGTQIFLVLSSGIVTGRAFDNGYFHHMMIAGALLNSFSFFMLSLSHQNQYYQVFLSHGLGGGLAAGLVYTPTLAIGSHYFRRHRALSIGFVVSGAGLGAVLHPIMLNHLFSGPSSFARGVRISAALNSSLLIIANLMMRTRLPPKKVRSRIPFTEFARDMPYVFVVMGGMVTIFGVSFAVFFIQLYSGGNKIAQYSLSIMNAASIVGRTIPALFVSRCGIVNMIIFITICMAALIYSLAAVETARGIVAFAVIYGILEGGAITLTPAMLASLAEDVDEIGARIGVSFALSGIIGLFVTPIQGALLTRQLHWWRPIMFTGTMVSGGALCYIIARFLLVQRRGTHIV